MSQYYPQPPPIPQPQKSHTLKIILVVLLVAIIFIPAILFFSGAFNRLFNIYPPASPTPYPSSSLPPVASTDIIITTGQKIQTTTQTIGSTGGTVQVTDSSSPLRGLRIVVPEAATTEPIRFDVSYSDVSAISGIPETCSVVSKMVTIETSGSAVFNQYQMFEKAVTVTLPYNANAANEDDAPVRFYWYDAQTRKLDSAGFLSQDENAHTITFTTGSFSDFVAIRTMLNITGSKWGLDVPVDTGFRPVRDGWLIPNYGSYLDYSTATFSNSTTGGFCLGMVSFAKWYYGYIGTGLHDKYIQGDRVEWRDDATAIQLAARAHIATSGIWGSLTSEEQDWAKGNAKEVALSWVSGMIVTGEPQLIGLRARFNNGTWRSGGHAIMTYAYKNGVFEIYDPNFPGSAPGDTMRAIPFTYNQGFNQTYVSGLTRADNLVFNIFYHAGSKLSATPDDYKGIYDASLTGFKDNSLFPTVTLTDATTIPTGTTPTDTDSDGVRDTTQAKVTISGTITGGAQAVNSTLIFVSNNKYTADVVDGVFSKEIPLMAGVNDVVILATDINTFYNWAGFLRDSIKSSASPAELTITLTWDQDQSDVDLHVMEPGVSGRHIYWRYAGDEGENPYLDMDNTDGYGPEHYYATQDMTLPDSNSLYGIYQVRVEYYADHDDNTEEIQPITWHLNVKYLAFKDKVTGQEFWYEETRSGTLSVTQSSGTNDFTSDGPAWTDIWTINYQAPDPQNYGIPPPPQNKFP